MPASAALIPLISAGAALGGTGISAFSTGNMNRKSRQFSQEMYQRQFNDNVAFWNMQNEYNSPQAQMLRFQDAGLNPNLIYGQGNSGPAGAVQTPDVVRPEFNPIDASRLGGDALGIISAIYDLDIKKAQADNLKAQNSVILQDAMLRAAQIQSTQAGTDRSRFDLGLDSELREVSADSRREMLRQLKTNIDQSIDKNAREAALASSSIQEAASRMLSQTEERLTLQKGRQKADTEMSVMRQNLKLMQQEGVLKELDIELRKQGINPQDPIWARIVGRLLANWVGQDKPLKPGETKSTLQKARDSFWNWIFN